MAAVINARTVPKAAIKRASRRARADMGRLDREGAADLARIYTQARTDLEAQILGYAGREGSVRLEVLQDLLGQVRGRLATLGSARDQALDAGLRGAARLGARPFEGALVGVSLNHVAEEAVRFVRSFTAEDGLQLSDRIWRIDQRTRTVVTRAIESAVIQGHSASRAAAEFLGRGQPVPGDIAAAAAGARGDRIARVTGETLMTGEGSPYDHALRLYRTEINRAHGEAYRASAEAHPDAAGTRFLLSPNHPRVDVCDMHASVNRYGLGPGVYPFGRSPWPAHPNTLSFEEVVFQDEITREDRGSAETRVEWLRRQPAAVQASVLGSRSKQAALRQGVLVEGEIATPWKVLRLKYVRRGIDIVGGVNPAGLDRPIPVTSTARGAGPVIAVADEEFVPATSITAATRRTREIVDSTQARAYQKDEHGQYLVRYRHGRQYEPGKVRAEKYNRASLAKLDLGTANALNRGLLAIRQVSRQLGLPDLRGVHTAAGAAAASMGDGVLAVSPHLNRYFKPRLQPAEAIANLERVIGQREAALQRFVETQGGDTVAANYRKDIDLLREKLKAIRAGRNVYDVLNPPSTWRPGSGTAPPDLSDAYFADPEDKFESTLWHEFGHHVHQQLGVASRQEYAAPPLERRLAALYHTPGRTFPTGYSRTNPKEWWAESYALYRKGRSDLLDKDLLGLIHEVERGQFKP